MMYLNKLKNLLLQQTWSESDVCYIMVNFRSFLEQRKIKEKHPIINLYCNWALHPMIHKSEMAFQILEHITNSLYVDYKSYLDYSNSPKSHGVGQYNTSRFADAVIEGLQLHVLFEEIINIGEEYEIPEIFVFRDKDRRRFFVNQLLLILLEKPIKRSEKYLSTKFKKYEQSAENIHRKEHKEGVLDSCLDPYSVLACGFVMHENTIYWKIMTELSYITKKTLLGEVRLATREEFDEARKKELIAGR